MIYTPCDQTGNSGGSVELQETLGHMQSNLQIYTVHDLHFFGAVKPKKTCLRANHIHYFYKMCMKGGGGQPLEVVGQALSDEQQSTEQSTVLYTHSVMLPAFC